MLKHRVESKLFSKEIGEMDKLAHKKAKIEWVNMEIDLALKYGYQDQNIDEITKEYDEIVKEEKEEERKSIFVLSPNEMIKIDESGKTLVAQKDKTGTIKDADIVDMGNGEEEKNQTNIIILSQNKIIKMEMH